MNLLVSFYNFVFAVNPYNFRFDWPYLPGSADIASIILLWTHDNPPPATLILISDNEELYVNSELIPLLRDRGYTILRVFGNRPKFSHSYYHQTFLWKHFFQVFFNSRTEIN